MLRLINQHFIVMLSFIRGNLNFTTRFAWCIPLLLVFSCTTSAINPKKLDSGELRELGDLQISLSFPHDISTSGIQFNKYSAFNIIVARLVINNIGNDTLLINRDDVVLLDNKNNYYAPISDEGQITLTFYRELRNGFRNWGFPETLLLEPSDKFDGYLFYDVGSDFEVSNMIRLSVSKINVIGFEEYSF